MLRGRGIPHFWPATFVNDSGSSTAQLPYYLLTAGNMLVVHSTSCMGTSIGFCCGLLRGQCFTAVVWGEVWSFSGEEVQNEWGSIATVARVRYRHQHNI